MITNNKKIQSKHPDAEDPLPAKATIDAIAKRMGISHMTVARALNGDPRKHPKALKRVEEVLRIAREMGYRRNSAARAMSLGRLNTISIVQCGPGRNSYLPPERILGIQHALAEHDIGLMINRVDMDKLEDPDYVPGILSNLSADGLLMDVIMLNSPRMVSLIDEYNVPAIWINVKHNHDVVRPDDLGAGISATQKLLQLGHRRIGYWDFSAPENPHYSRTDRYHGYVKAMSNAGLIPNLLQTPHKREEERHATAYQLLQSADRPTAIVSYHLADVIGIFTAAHRLGLSIPGDLSIISFQRYMEVTRAHRMTIMVIPDYAVGEQAVHLLLNKIQNPRVQYDPVLVPFDFCDSGSIGPPRE